MTIKRHAGAPQGDPDYQTAQRLFGKERRRTKVIPHAFGERAVLKLMDGAPIRAADR